MTELDDRIHSLIFELVDSAPPAPTFPAVGGPSKPARGFGRAAGAAVAAVTIAVALGVWIGVSRPDHRRRVLSVAPPASEVQSTPTSPAINVGGFPESVLFQDQSEGWGITSSCTQEYNGGPSESCAFQAFVTNDGGRTWRTRGSEHRFDHAMKSQYDDTRVDAVIADATTAWLTGAHPEVTRDGGLSWATEPLPGIVSAVDPVPGGAWALARGCAADDCAPALYRLGGDQRWSLSPGQPPGENAGSRLAAVSPSVAYLFSGGGVRANQGPLVRTTDGGQRWQQLPVPCSSDWNELAVLDAARLWLFCGDQPSTGEQPGQLFRSSDGGQHWSLVADAVRPGITESPRRQVGNLPSSGFEAQILPLPTGELYLAKGKFGLVARSSDGGTTWVDLLGNDNGGGYRLVALDHTVIWAQSTGCLWRTVNAGQHWTLMNNRSGYGCGTPRPQGAQ